MEAQAEEWDHELFMVPDRAIAPTFIFAGMLTRGKRLLTPADGVQAWQAMAHRYTDLT
jgi:hypothetical protein